MPFDHLLSPLHLGDLVLRNRVVMGSMHTGLEDDLGDIDKLTAYFVERAAGGVGLIITGAFAVNHEGRLKEGGITVGGTAFEAAHRTLTDAVHAEGSAIAMQLIHAGRYAYHDESVGASSLKSPITPFSPRALSTDEVDATVEDFVAAAVLAQSAGYDAVEVMGSEGYLINQFLAARTNDRADRWGGDVFSRMRFPLEIVRRTRAAVGPDLPIIYRISLLDLVDNGQTWDETVELAQALVEAGVTAFNTGIGWHEAKIPTIITQVPRGAWTPYTARLKQAVSVPVCASNRINTPDLAESLVAEGQADLVSMARPLLADPSFVAKTASGRADEINTCIACNQACLDHGFSGLMTSCLVNPRACEETTFTIGPTRTRATLAVVGGGPAGLSAAVTAAERGLRVTLFEADEEIGGQFRLAKEIPGKEDFSDTLRYFSKRLEALGVDVRLGSRADVDALAPFDHVIVATGVRPRVPIIQGLDHPSVATYAEVLNGSVVPGKTVAVIGAGGIGVDVSHWLTHDHSEDVDGWKARWGVDPTWTRPGGVTVPQAPHTPRSVTLLQRKPTPIGIGLGKTSGWAHRMVLHQAGVKLVSGATYDLIDDRGLHYTVGGESRRLPVESVIVCAGQESVRDVYDALADDPRVHLVGGAAVAGELDAKRAIREGTQVAASLQ